MYDAERHDAHERKRKIEIFPSPKLVDDPVDCLFCLNPFVLEDSTSRRILMNTGLNR